MPAPARPRPGDRLAALSLSVALVLAACSSHPTFVVPETEVGTPQFARLMEAHTLSGLAAHNSVRLLLNGEQIFPSMLEAIRGARQTITFANYIYEDGAIADEFADAFAERCRAGVGVNILLDATGSNQMPKRLRERMSTSGCHVEMFHPLSAFAIKRVNHRNHRRILVVDGRVGFIGGTGVGTNWTGDGKTPHHWRQTDVRIEGPVVRALQAAFAEPWRETTGVLLGGDAYFPEIQGTGTLSGQSVKSSPVGGAAEAYMLFLLAIDGARSSIKITNPYFVPDTPMMDAMERAVARGVRVEVIMAGEADTNLDRIVRKASQGMFGRALEAGIKIHEYRGALLHAKTITVDGRWSSVGSANLDRRSFALNHELNIAFDDPGLAHELERIFADDLTRAHEVTLAEWRKRGLGRLLEIVVLPLRDEL
jgi:cardiolipin synthase